MFITILQKILSDWLLIMDKKSNFNSDFKLKTSNNLPYMIYCKKCNGQSQLNG